MDYLYDKVGFYDTLKVVMRDNKPTSALLGDVAALADIDQHMLHFMENHDEQRINSADFAGSAENGKPGMVVSTLMTQSPTMLYFAQDVGEPGAEDLGFGDPTRTSIFDYGGVPSHQRWMNGGKFDGGQSTDSEKALRDFYQKLLQFSATSKAMNGNYLPIHQHNLAVSNGYTERQLAFVRWRGDERVIAVSNFAKDNVSFVLQVPAHIIQLWQLNDGKHSAAELFSGADVEFEVTNGQGSVNIELGVNESAVLRFWFLGAL